MEIILENYRIYGWKRFLEDVIDNGFAGCRGMVGIVGRQRPIYVSVWKRLFKRESSLGEHGRQKTRRIFNAILILFRR